MEVKLTRGKVAVVDDEDFETLSKHSWCAMRNYYGGWLAARGEKGKTIYMHRQLLNCPPNLQVDHIDHDTLNNTKSNLRIVTIQQNCLNRGIRSDNRTGFKGVSLVKSSGKYTARIVINGSRICVGYFDSAEEAHKAYVEYSKQYHGEYSRYAFGQKGLRK
jgi:hypothetical protein